MYRLDSDSRSAARRTMYPCREKSAAHHTFSTLMRLVLPETSHGTPAVITMQSPCFASRRLRMRSRTTSNMASYPGTWSTRTGTTPHTSASWRYVVDSVVTARIGTGGRSAATLRAVNPPLVSVTMSGVFSMRATANVPQAIASSVVTPRSEEHTSELQSRLHLVCRLL